MCNTRHVKTKHAGSVEFGRLPQRNHLQCAWLLYFVTPNILYIMPDKAGHKKIAWNRSVEFTRSNVFTTSARQSFSIKGKRLKPTICTWSLEEYNELDNHTPAAPAGQCQQHVQSKQKIYYHHFYMWWLLASLPDMQKRLGFVLLTLWLQNVTCIKRTIRCKTFIFIWSQCSSCIYFHY